MRAALVALALSACGSPSSGPDGGGPDLALAPDLAGAPVLWLKVIPPTSDDLFAVAADAGGALYAVGARGTILLSTDGGKSWAAQSSGTVRDLFALWPRSPGEVVVVGGGGTILRTVNHGASWLGEPSNTPADLHAIAGVAGGEAWAVGQAGTIVHTKGDGTWLPETSPTTSDLLGAWVAADGAHALGRAGTLIARANGAWSTAPSPTALDLYASDGSFASGASGLLLERSGPSWNTDATGTSSTLTALSPGGINKCQLEIAVGLNGTALHRCGTAFQLDATGTDQNLYGVTSTGADAFAVGAAGTLLHRSTW